MKERPRALSARGCLSQEGRVNLRVIFDGASSFREKPFPEETTPLLVRPPAARNSHLLLDTPNL